MGYVDGAIQEYIKTFASPGSLQIMTVYVQYTLMACICSFWCVLPEYMNYVIVVQFSVGVFNRYLTPYLKNASSVENAFNILKALIFLYGFFQQYGLLIVYPMWITSVT